LKPVLGLFDNEDQLRDFLASNLGLIEQGLKLVDKNYPVTTLQGADGALDILARDKHDSFVIIEVKRSESAARQALHELSKYLAAFVTTQHVDEHKLRCFVVSTLWHELDTPLAYFRSTVKVDVKGFEVTAPGGKVKVAERVLPPMDSLPKLCPDTLLLQATPGQSMTSIIDELKQASAKLPMVRAALLQFEHKAGHEDLAVLCLWRVADSELDNVRRTLGLDYRDNRGAHYPEWEEESAVLNWLMDQSTTIAPAFDEMRRGTPEKIASVLERRPFEKLVQLGSWPKKDLVHSLSEMQRCVVAQDISSSGRRANRYFFNGTSSPKAGPSWKYASAAFASFLGFEPFWQSEVERFLATVGNLSDVVFLGQDCRHFQFRIYQHLHNSNAQLSQFKITVSDAAGATTHIMMGGWAWDGETCPDNVIAQLIDTYGSVDEARIMLFSSKDDRRYESALRAHGFHPFVIELDKTTNEPDKLYWHEPCPGNLDYVRGIEHFVASNSSYCEGIAQAYAGIPTEPDGSRRPVLFELTGQ
jgi:hypothetical protein